MIIPIKCVTCGKTLADKWDWYDEEVQKKKKMIEEGTDKSKKLTKKEEAIQEPLQYFDKIKTGDLLDKLGLTRYCCRRHFLGHVDMMQVI
uniref:DNA-directed RNA polymerase subunit N n=1 Tax=viral metagenome TaxID=1070528 RepID=A0A6C0CSY1_9ZZZZ